MRGAGRNGSQETTPPRRLMADEGDGKEWQSGNHPPQVLQRRGFGKRYAVRSTLPGKWSAGRAGARMALVMPG